jgi:hypothetical protein
VLVLLLVIDLERLFDRDHEQEHEREIARGNTLWNKQSRP